MVWECVWKGGRRGREEGEKGEKGRKGRERRRSDIDGQYPTLSQAQSTQVRILDTASS